MALVLEWKTQFTLLFLIIGMYASQVTSRILQESSSMLEKHESWMARHGKTYENDAEKTKRLNIFKKNVKFIESFNNNGTKPYKLGINEFADLTSEEFLRYYTNHGLNNKFSSTKSQQLSPTTISSFKYENMSDVPSDMDWRKSGVVTSIKNQGQCGCCWAFSAVAALEGANKLSTGKLISLSEQQLLDCTTENNGCSGGLMTTAYDFILKNGGITAESDYPYEENQDSCKSQETDSAVKISRYEILPSSESTLLNVVAQQPASVGIAVNEDFHLYQTGVYDGNCGDQLNHAVTIIGYGTDENGTKYWLIKNSWGTSWGENGYMKIARDIGIKGGLCGITTLASYPVL